MRNHVSNVEAVVFFWIFLRHSCHGELVEIAQDRSFINMLSTFPSLFNGVAQLTEFVGTYKIYWFKLLYVFYLLLKSYELDAT